MADKKRSEAAKKGWITRRKSIAGKNTVRVVTQVKRIGPARKKSLRPGLTKARIKEWFDDKNLSEIYNSGLQYAFISKDWKQCHTFAYCKDFLQDAVWAELNKKKASIYGFCHTHGENPPVDLKRTRLAIRYKGKEGIKKLCRQSLTFLNELEKEMSFEPTVLHFGGKYKDTPSSVFIFEGDPKWMYSPVLISLYSLAIRVGLTYEGSGWRKHFEAAKSYLGNNDNGYTNTAKKALDKIVGKEMASVFAPTMKKNYPPDVGIHGMHDYSGIVSFGNANIDNSVKKHW